MGVAKAGVDSDVVVVGAGISGLHVARGLVGRGVSVVVLEGRDRVGGRLRSESTTHGHRVDLGATWFWPGERRVAALVRDLEVVTHEQYLTGDAMYELPDGARRLDGNPIDVPALRFTDGAQELARRLATRLPTGTVRLGTAVTEVSGTGPFTVRHQHGSITARHVVVAVPPALAVSSIRFEPELPVPVDRIARNTPVWMGATTKAVVVYARPFWRDRGLSGSAISHVGPLREIHDMSSATGSPAALFGFGQSADGAPIGIDDVVRQLRTLFGDDATQPLDVLVADWRSESLTSPAAVERHRSYELFGHPALQTPGDRPLHWASTETARESPGHIEGALDAAERTLAAILSG